MSHSWMLILLLRDFFLGGNYGYISWSLVKSCSSSWTLFPLWAISNWVCVGILMLSSVLWLVIICPRSSLRWKVFCFLSIGFLWALIGDLFRSKTPHKSCFSKKSFGSNRAIAFTNLLVPNLPNGFSKSELENDESLFVAMWERWYARSAFYYSVKKQWKKSLKPREFDIILRMSSWAAY